LGHDVGSGTNQSDLKNPSYNKSHSFDRLYGSPHSHFGYLDYFYTGTPTLCGIKDLYLKTKIKINSRISIEEDVHYFQTQAKLNDTKNKDLTMPNFLGTENDILINYKVSSNFKTSLGHSIMFGTPTLDAFFGGKVSKQKQYFYIVITATTNFFKSKKQQENKNLKVEAKK